MKTVLFRWIKANKAIFANAGSLIGTWGVTSGLGFVYWWLAARVFVPQEVGIGSASISVMTLLGTICMMGLGTLLITELPRQPENAGSLLSTSLIIVGIVGGVGGFLFAMVAPSVSASFAPLRTSMGIILLFALGVSLTSITLVLDMAMIGLLLGGVQLWRNLLFALSKLIILYLLSRWFAQAAGMGIYAAWAIGNVLSLVLLVGLVLCKKSWRRKRYLPEWSLLRKMGGVAMQHHLLNLALAAPTLILPVMVTVMLSAQANAWFYVAWMVANFVFVVPGSLTMVLHAINSAQKATLKNRARMTLSLAFAVSLVAIIVLVFGAKLVLSFFGSAYASEASWTLQILVLAAIPSIIKSHYISICRIYDRITEALLGMIPAGLLELGGAAAGAHVAGLVGLSLGWVGAMAIESIFMLPTLYNVVFAKEQDEQSEQAATDPVWLMDTALLPAIGSGYGGSEPLWLINSALQPAIGRKPAEAQSVWLLETTRLPAIKPPARQTPHRTLRKARLEVFHTSKHRALHTTQPTTDPSTDPEFAKVAHDNSPVFEDEVR
ncbi:MAG TPA: oligosaccharide flippase family protein [Ktedonobacteraceae bacterium]|jgi:O-antigen/teichoic acid export membrane protein|nr:oligosaccharide flippase family protein [Ktedonobacteraceae bacterium]